MLHEKENKNESDRLDRHDEFMRLYLPVQRTIYAYIAASLCDWNDVDDIIQETLSYMWAQFDDFEPGTNFAAWAITVARYRILNHTRNSSKNTRVFCDEALVAVAQSINSVSRYEKERIETLRGCVAKLKPEERELLSMRYDGSSTVRSIAERMHRSVHTLYKTFRRIHITLFNCVERSLAKEY